MTSQEETLADELHKPIRRNFLRRRVFVEGIDEIWAADLVEMQKFAKWNKGIRYLLTVIDVFSKFGWIEPLKDKKGETVAEAFKNIFEKGRKPEKLWTDKGKEFFNQHMNRLLKEKNIILYTTENEQKSSVIERWNRTMKEKMWKRFTQQNSTVYIDDLPGLVNEYNNTKHSSIKMTPVEASLKKNESNVWLNLFGKWKGEKTNSKFKIDDMVRISKLKRKVFDKGYTPNWTEEIFKIVKVLNTNPVTYQIADLRNEEIQGSFYESELQKTKQTQFRIEKVIRKNLKKKMAFVKWSGYSSDFNSWVPISDLVSF